MDWKIPSTHIPESVDAVIHRYAKAFASTPSFAMREQDDILQQLRIVVLKSISRYDPAKAKLETFIDRICESCCKSLARTEAAQKRDARRVGISLNDTVKDGDGGITQLANTFSADAGRRHLGTSTRDALDAMQLQWDVRRLVAKLSKHDQRVANLLMEGMSNSRIAETLGISRRQVDNAIQRMLSLFEKEGLREYR